MTPTRAPAGRRGRVPRGSGLQARALLRFAAARNVPAVLAAMSGLAVLAWWAARWLASRPMFDGPLARPPVVALAPLALAMLVGVTLVAADEELERTGAWAWRRLRLVQTVALTMAGTLALAMTSLEDARVYGAVELVRNVLGCVGLVAAAAVLVGARLAWAPAFAYVATVYLAAPKPVVPGTGWWTWPVQQSGSTAAWAACVAWFVVGVSAYAWWGSGRRWHSP